MTIKKTEKGINQWIIWYCIGIINIEDLVNFVIKHNFQNQESKHVVDMIKKYDFYKKHGDEKIITDLIKEYYLTKLINL